MTWEPRESHGQRRPPNRRMTRGVTAGDLLIAVHRVQLNPDATQFFVYAGFLGDMEKYNAAIVSGWRVVRVVPGKLCASATVGMLESLLQSEIKQLAGSAKEP